MANLAERNRLRRQQLIDAGIPLIGLPGGKPVGVRDVCRSAGLTERYFYQAFGSRENYVRAVCDQVGVQARAAVELAVSPDMTREERAHTAVMVFLDQFIDRPANGRVILVGPATEPVLGVYSAKFAVEFVHYVKGSLGDNDDVERHLSALAIVGGLTALFTGYLYGSIGTTRDRFIEFCVDFILAGQDAQIA